MVRHLQVRRLSVLMVLLLGLLSALLPASDVAAQPASPGATGVDPAVYAALEAAADGQATFLVYFRDRADLSAASGIEDWAARGQFVMERLQATARASQARILDRLTRKALPGRVARFQPFWVANVVVVTGDRAAAEWLARQPEVAGVLPELKLDPPEPPDVGLQSVQPNIIPYGIAKIKADQVWAMGYKGQGVVLGGVDTGVQWDHPALKAQYRGWNGVSASHNYNWWDPANFCGPWGSAPCDTNGHGTHTTGTQAGDHTVYQIGVAPDAQWIHAAGCCASNESLLSALQWMLAPTDMYGNNPNPALRPHAVNNSWGGPGGSKIFHDAIANLRAAGVVPVFSAGNSGSACGTLGSPGDNLVAFNVGATDSNDNIASFSSRGSNPFNGLTDPDVTAPGVGVLSSVPGNAYASYSGTSMAAPHVTGAVALILSAEPDLTGKVDQIEELLRRTALPRTSTQTCGGVPGSQVPNNTYGWGRIDVLAAVNMVKNAGTLSGTVIDAGTSQPIAGATVSITRSGITLTQKTATNGTYSFVAGAGTYQVTATAFGYGSQTVSGVTVTQDNITTQNFSLSSLSTGSISGTVLENGNPALPVPGATVSVVGSGLSAATNASGAYTLNNVPFGTYTVRMTAAGYATLSASVTVDGPETQNFGPAPVPDYVVGDGGDTCSVEFSWIDATVGGTAHNLDDDAFTSVALPWPFTFYGNSYSTLYISSNGFVSFGQGYSKWHGIVPFEGAPNNQIIGLGEDLNPANGTQGKIYTKNLGDGRFVVQYHQVQHWASGNPETFQIILNNNDGSIVVQYHTVSWPDFANAGIENADGSRGIQYSYANHLPLTDGLALKYTPFTGQPPACLSAVAPTVQIAASGSNVQLSWTHLAPNQKYQVWRDGSPYFDPAQSQGTLLATLNAASGTMTYPDPGRIGGQPDFYLVRGWVVGEPSGPSNRVGEFSFSLTPGAP
ncbi:MAG: S8 family serine peptidase [Anaerolineae bacterium]|nr:S8 family serine peptidase [Anaerolineae bacterium]